MLKYSLDPEVRRLYYKAYSTSVPNAEILLQLNNLRHSNTENYHKICQAKNLLHIGDFEAKLSKL